MAVASSSATDIDVFFLGVVTKDTPAITEQPDSKNKWLEELPINRSTVEFKIDTRRHCQSLSEALALIT